MRRLVVVAVAAAALASAAPAAATDECRGFMICVPVAGPWVVVPTREGARRPTVEYELRCPRRYTVGGLDAERSVRGIDVEFRGRLGSPVSPGVTTTRTAVFTATYVGRGRPTAPTFRPHIGCIPGGGGGQRIPTAVGAVSPAPPAVRRVKTVRVVAGRETPATVSCTTRERLVGSTHAVGFHTRRPPSAALVRSVRAARQTSGRRVSVAYTAGAAIQGVRAVVQVAAICSGAR